MYRLYAMHMYCIQVNIKKINNNKKKNSQKNYITISPSLKIKIYLQNKLCHHDQMHTKIL